MQRVVTDEELRCQHLRRRLLLPWDAGAAVGASDQIGWTGVVARLIQMFGNLSGEESGGGKQGYFNGLEKRRE